MLLVFVSRKQKNFKDGRRSLHVDREHTRIMSDDGSNFELDFVSRVVVGEEFLDLKSAGSFEIDESIEHLAHSADVDGHGYLLIDLKRIEDVVGEENGVNDVHGGYRRSENGYAGPIDSRSRYVLQESV